MQLSFTFRNKLWWYPVHKFFGTHSLTIKSNWIFSERRLQLYDFDKQCEHILSRSLILTATAAAGFDIKLRQRLRHGMRVAIEDCFDTFILMTTLTSSGDIWFRINTRNKFDVNLKYYRGAPCGDTFYANIWFRINSLLYKKQVHPVSHPQALA